MKFLMEIFETKNDLRKFLQKFVKEKKTIGFVPTMGALHKGHLSLISRAKKENDIVVCSIFVNPIQFNNKEDLKKYPRTLEKDISLLKKQKCDVLFAPQEKEMYSQNDSSNTLKINFGKLEKVMEGKFRPGHFRGVAIIVNKLFNLVQPHRAYFGEKDFQQLVIVKKMTKILKHNIEIVSCPTVREKDGLAMSSRNIRLSKQERNIAPFIFKILKETKKRSAKFLPQEIKKWAEKQFQQNKNFRLEYFEIADAETLQPIKKWNKKKSAVACVAAYLGNVRLIDNIGIL